MLLTLDISLTCGVSWGGPMDGRPYSAVWKLPDGEDNFDRALASLRGSVMAMCKFQKVTDVAIEAAMQKVNWQHSAYSALLLTSLSAVAREAATQYGARVEMVAVSTWRANVLGTARLNTEDAKRAAKQMNDQLGWTYQDHNSAESNCLWLHKMSLKYPRWAPNRPMREAA